jgi:hypothetical protein
VSSRARLDVGLRVVQKAAVNGVGELSFESSESSQVAAARCSAVCLRGL